jgi:hypothetical protein
MNTWGACAQVASTPQIKECDLSQNNLTAVPARLFSCAQVRLWSAASGAGLADRLCRYRIDPLRSFVLLGGSRARARWGFSLRT